jgi:hypothetical protein
MSRLKVTPPIELSPRAHLRDPRARADPPEELGLKSDLNDWLRLGAKGDPAALRSVPEQAHQTSATPWASRSNGCHRTGAA